MVEGEGTVDERGVVIEQSENVRKAQQEDSDVGPLLKLKEDNRLRPGWLGGILGKSNPKSDVRLMGSRVRSA